jgi:hypothetical protein
MEIPPGSYQHTNYVCTRVMTSNQQIPGIVILGSQYFTDAMRTPWCIIHEVLQYQTPFLLQSKGILGTLNDGCWWVGIVGIINLCLCVSLSLLFLAIKSSNLLENPFPFVLKLHIYIVGR